MGKLATTFPALFVRIFPTKYVKIWLLRYQNKVASKSHISNVNRNRKMFVAIFPGKNVTLFQSKFQPNLASRFQDRFVRRFQRKNVGSSHNRNARTEKLINANSNVRMFIGAKNVRLLRFNNFKCFDINIELKEYGEITQPKMCTPS